MCPREAVSKELRSTSPGCHVVWGYLGALGAPGGTWLCAHAWGPVFCLTDSSILQTLTERLLYAGPCAGGCGGVCVSCALSVSLARLGCACLVVVLCLCEVSGEALKSSREGSPASPSETGLNPSSAKERRKLGQRLCAAASAALSSGAVRPRAAGCAGAMLGGCR